MTVGRLVTAGFLTEFAYLTFYITDNALHDTFLFVAVNAVAYCLLGWVIMTSAGPGEAGLFRSGSFSAASDAMPGKKMLLIIAFGVLFRMTLVWHEPVASQDILRYVWDGKVAAAGFNPYAIAPNDPQLAGLHTDRIPAGISFPEMRTIYPPLSQVFFYFSNMVFGDSVAGMKLLLFCVDLAGLLILLRILPLVKVSRNAIILYCWSPTIVMYTALDGHIDVLGAVLLLLFLLLWLQGSTGRSALVLGLAGLAKLYPLFCAALLARKGGLRSIGWTTVPFLLVLGGYVLYYEPTGGVYESLVEYNTTFEFNGPVFTLVVKLIGSNTHARVVCALLFALWLSFVVVLKRPAPMSVMLTFVGFIMVSPTVHPWYLVWLAVLLPAQWSPAVFVLLCTSNLSNVVVYDYHASGLWTDRPWIIALEYLPFLLLLVWEIRKGLWSRTELSAE